MRLVYKLLFNPQDRTSEPVLYETDDDGQNRRVLQGTLPTSPTVRRVTAYIEVSCDGSAETIEDTLGGLTQIQEQLRTRTNTTCGE